MNEPFLILVSFLGKKYSFEAQLYSSSYSYRIEILIDDIPFSFERDDEGTFRAIAANPEENKHQKINPKLLQAVSDSLREILS